MSDSPGAGAPLEPISRVASMDHFRGLTILLMFAVHDSNSFSWGVNLAPLFRHNHYYLSVGDLAFPWFHFAAGFALRLTLLRRLQARGAWAAYARVVRRCLLLIFLADGMPLLLGGPHAGRWGLQQRSDPLAQLAAYVKWDGWSILAIIGVTSLWVLPAIGRSARVRVGFLLGGLAVHALATQAFYMHFMNGLPNPVDAVLGTAGVRGREGGPLGFLVWAVPQIAGSFAYDVVARQRSRTSCAVLLRWGLVLAGIGYALSCLSNLYPVAQGPRADSWSYPDTDQNVASPVVPPLGSWLTGREPVCLPDPPFSPPPPERQRIYNYWMMSRRLTTPTFVLTATGFALLVYALCVVFCDAWTVEVGLLRTFGQNPLIAYLLDPLVGDLVSGFWPAGGGLPMAFAGAAVRIALTYLPVRLLEWRRIYLRL
jgi:predicted acyltransferase